MNIPIKALYVAVASTYFLPLFGSNPSFSCEALQNDRYRCTIEINLEPADAILFDTIDISVDDPTIDIVSWQATDPTRMYIPEFKETKKVLAHKGSLEVVLKTTNSLHNASIHIRYYQRKSQHIVEHSFPLHLENTPPQTLSNLRTQKNIPTPIVAPEELTTVVTSTSWIGSLSSWFAHTNSISVRLILAFLLGLLLSLTPCIYPMIPITIGILQSQAQPSFRTNVGLALSYTMGIATTFSVLGLIAAFTGQLFGNVMSHPIVILAMVALLLYLAGSMLGLYEMYTPSYVQNGSIAKGGSFASAFMFGALSGTVTSPCLSPGLMLLLTMVSKLQNMVLGFILLFSFGIGLSTPLLIIGSFSTSLQVLPAAGTWMVDVKQLIGIMMIGMCFYFLNSILPFHISLLIFGFFIMCTGLFYLYQAQKIPASFLRTVKNTGGTLLIAASLLFLAKGYQFTDNDAATTAQSFWLSDYVCCIEQAKQENKKVLLDVSASYCTICKAIDASLFTKKDVIEALSQSVIPVKIDEFDTNNPLHCMLQKKYNIMGVPTLLLIDPTTEELISCWGSELYDYNTTAFVTELQTKVRESTIIAVS